MPEKASCEVAILGGAALSGLAQPIAPMISVPIACCVRSGATAVVAAGSRLGALPLQAFFE